MSMKGDAFPRSGAALSASRSRVGKCDFHVALGCLGQEKCMWAMCAHLDYKLILVTSIVKQFSGLPILSDHKQRQLSMNITEIKPRKES